MTKAQLIEKIAGRGNFSKSEAERVLNAFLDAIEDGLAQDGNVTLKEFGVFKVLRRAERTGHDPRSGKEITIPAQNIISFKPATKFKELIN